jgi:hypothetical protein
MLGCTVVEILSRKATLKAGSFNVTRAIGAASCSVLLVGRVGRRGVSFSKGRARAKVYLINLFSRFLELFEHR